MKTLNTFIFSLLIFMNFSIYASSSEVIIKGKITNSNGQTIYLQKFIGNKNITIDSSLLKKDGKFLFNISVDKKDFYSLTISGSKKNEMVLLVLDNEKSDQKISLNADASSLPTTYNVEGSIECDIIEGFVKLINDYGFKRTNASDIYFSNDISNEEKDRAKKVIDSLDNTFKKSRNEFINNNYDQLAVLIAVGYLNPQQDIDYLKKIVTGLEISAPNSEYHLAIQAQVSQVEEQLIIQRKQQAEQQMMLDRTKIGTVAPELGFKNPEGEIIQLKSLRGKYVLIDFWASWCKPCRMENPNVVKLYEKYKSKKFTVYSVSLDKSKERWINAIKQDNLSWPNHVSDLKQWQTEATKIYGFKGIPYTVLIDKEGMIIAKNLRGHSLEAKLKEIFKE